MKKSLVLLSLIGLLTLPAVASAHAVVKPSEAKAGSFQTFTLGVPAEGTDGTTEVRLIVPQGLDYVTPNIKANWKTEKVIPDGTHVTELIWKGNIPQGYRDEFVFSAKVPTSTPLLAWKVYQKHEDGSVKAWDMDPNMTMNQSMSNMDASAQGPYSVTKITDGNAAVVATTTPPSGKNTDTLDIVALVLSVIALAVASKKRN